MKNLRDSAGIVRSLARQYQAVIDLAEHVGEGDKLEAQHAEAEKRLAATESKIKDAEQRRGNAQKALEDLDKKLEEKREEVRKTNNNQSEVYALGEAEIRKLESATKTAETALTQANRKIDAAEAQLLDIQGTINEKKDELSRLQAKINEVQAALAKVA